MTNDVLERLIYLIHSKRTECKEKSYTRQLFDAGLQHCAKKLGEEAVETAIAGITQTDEDLVSETADLVYHLLVLLEIREVHFYDVLDVLEQRMGTSGIDEKASRTN
ncbi:MAG: phosphoribosyl-ATP diphosphatase [Hyphomicrobiaceae bacterium]|nr:phosphoribosyl-ATP diphosphatase [Hyphomicrobiaceae bacterium]